MSFRATVLAIPVVLGLAAVTADAATVTLTPLSPAHRTQVAASGATCADPYAPAKATAVSFNYPAISREIGAEGIADVGITLLPDGRVARAWAIKSTGNKMLDRAAMDSALDTRYVAERSQCAAIGGDYKVEVEFSLDR